MKPYKGFIIEKSWETSEFTEKKIDIMYTAYTKDGNGVFDCTKTLPELKKKINSYIKA